MARYSIELSFPDSVDVVALADPTNNVQLGDEVCRKSDFGKALADCCRSGDCEDACRYLLTKFKPEFWIVKQVNGRYARVQANHIDKAYICHKIYFESKQDWPNSEEWCDIYLIWQAACLFTDR
jgi:hypothetical protein